MNKKIVILSLFDGISAGQIAIDRLGIKNYKYYASEIDKYAITVTQANYPNTIQIGNVSNISYKDGVLHSEQGEFNVGEVDLIIGGFPCTNLSISGRREGMSTIDNVEILSLNQYLKLKNKGVEFTGQSYLFWEFVRLINEIKPKYFLAENVRMQKKWKDVITNYLRVEPIEINSAKLSAQNRNRLYWTNIPNINQPEDLGLTLRSIVHENVDLEKSAVMKNGKAYTLTASYDGAIPYNSYKRKQRSMLFEMLKEYKVPFDNTLHVLNKNVDEGKMGYFIKDSQANRVYYLNNKSVTLMGNAGGGAAKMGQYYFGDIDLTKFHGEVELDKNKKHFILENIKDVGVLFEGYIRKLTPIECEKLQTVPTNYTNHVSNTQRYKMLGNGFTVDVIKHILSFADWNV